MKYIFSLFLVLFLGYSTQAQFPIALQELFQNSLDDIKMSSNAIGLSVAFRSEDDVWANVAGKSSSTENLTTESIFAIGSVSKTITSAVILDMMEEGLLTLDDNLGEYIGIFNNINPDITIYQLLNHTSGIYNYTIHPDFGTDVLSNGTQLVTAMDVLENYVNESIFEPGNQWSYSNTNYVILGMIIENISGNKNYLESRTRFDFDSNYPSLGMPPFEKDLNEIAHLWLDVTGLGLPPIDYQATGQSLDALFSAAGAAGAYAGTAIDVSQWAHDLYSGKFLDSETLDLMLEINFPSFSYGLGVLVGTIPCNMVIQGHGGNIIYTSATFYNPKHNISVSVHCNDASKQNVVNVLASELLCLYDDFISTVSVEDVIDEESIILRPNPFAKALKLSYKISKTSRVEMMLFDQMGNKIKQLVSTEKAKGTHVLTFGENIISGVYYVRMNFNNTIVTKRIVKL